MPKKILPGQEKRVTVASLSMEKSLFEKYSWYCSQKNIDVSKDIRNFIIKKLKLEKNYEADK